MELNLSTDQRNCSLPCFGGEMTVKFFCDQILKEKKRELKEQAVYRPKVETNCEKSDVLNYSV